jgi:phosphoserine aminotransferase
MNQINRQTRGYNFGAGPAMLPESILKNVQEELLNWHGTGMSILEIGHRTPLFIELMQEAEWLLRELLVIPDHYHVLFLSGAARTQFSMIPMNFIHPAVQAGYLVSGIWSYLAYKEAMHLSNAYCIGGSEALQYRDLPRYHVKDIRDETAYVYYTPNETINGVRFPNIPAGIKPPLIADMTSCLLSEPIQVSDYGLIFAGAQKNIAPAGLTLVIVRDDLLKTISAKLPTMLDYRVHAKERSLYATPATFQCYMALKMFQWIKAQGGVDSLYALNCQKASKLYKYIDESPNYQCLVEPNARSLMNVCFYLSDSSQEAAFIQQSNARGLYALQGHREVGGMRASLYNAMPMAGVDALIEFMQDFSRA